MESTITNFSNLIDEYADVVGIGEIQLRNFGMPMPVDPMAAGGGVPGTGGVTGVAPITAPLAPPMIPVDQRLAIAQRNAALAQLQGGGAQQGGIPGMTASEPQGNREGDTYFSDLLNLSHAVFNNVMYPQDEDDFEFADIDGIQVAYNSDGAYAFNEEDGQWYDVSEEFDDYLDATFAEDGNENFQERDARQPMLCSCHRMLPIHCPNNRAK